MSDKPVLITGHRVPSDMLHKVQMGSGKLAWTENELRGQHIRKRHFKKIVFDTFAEAFTTLLSIFMFHVLDHRAEDLRASSTSL